jgi:hypothetical protein
VRLLPTQRPRRPVARRAVLISRHLSTIRNVTLAFGAAGVETRIADEVPELPTAPANEVDLAVVDLDLAPGRDPTGLVDEARRRFPRALMMAVAGHDARRRLATVLAIDGLRHAVPKAPAAGAYGERAGRPPAGPGEEGLRCFEGPDERDLFVALRRRTADQIPALAGVAPYLSGAAQTIELRVRGSEDKEAAVGAVTALAERMLLTGELLRRIELVAEELVMNALYDAPVDESGRRRYADLNRTEPVHLTAKEEVRVRFGCDGRNFAVAVADRFGALDQATVSEHLCRTFAPGGARPASGRGGASLGLLMAFTAANQLVFSVIPSVATEVTAVFDVAGSNRASQRRGTAVHFYRPIDQPAAEAI